MAVRECKRCQTANPERNQEGKCKLCIRNRLKAYRQTPAYKKWRVEFDKKNYQKHRSKILVRRKVVQAVKQGIITKPKECQDCGEQALLQGHHDDYSKPLDVIWLCDTCHKIKHGRVKRTSYLIKGAAS